MMNNMFFSVKYKGKNVRSGSCSSVLIGEEKIAIETPLWYAARACLLCGGVDKAAIEIGNRVAKSYNDLGPSEDFELELKKSAESLLMLADFENDSPIVLVTKNGEEITVSEIVFESGVDPYCIGYDTEGRPIAWYRNLNEGYVLDNGYSYLDYRVDGGKWDMA